MKANHTSTINHLYDIITHVSAMQAYYIDERFHVDFRCRPIIPDTFDDDDDNADIHIFDASVISLNLNPQDIYGMFSKLNKARKLQLGKCDAYCAATEKVELSSIESEVLKFVMNIIPDEQSYIEYRYYNDIIDKYINEIIRTSGLKDYYAYGYELFTDIQFSNVIQSLHIICNYDELSNTSITIHFTKECKDYDNSYKFMNEVRDYDHIFHTDDMWNLIREFNILNVECFHPPVTRIV